MSDIKTKPTQQSVQDFLNSVEDPVKREDSHAILKLMEKATGSKGQMWGPSIIGFGSYRYKYKSGREGDWFLTGFSPRKQSLTLYIMPGFKHYGELLGKLGKHKIGKACLYINRLEQVDLQVLEQLIQDSVDWLASKSETK